MSTLSLSPRTRRRLVDRGLDALTWLVLGVMLAPVLWLVAASLQTDGQLSNGTMDLLQPTFSAFRDMWDSVDFERYFINSLIIVTLAATLATAFSASAGYALSRFRFRGKALVSLVLLLTQTFPLVMVIPPIYRIMGQLGLTDNLYGLIIIYTAFNIAFATFLMQSFLDGVPKDLEEAAMIDGCTRLAALRRVILPLTLPGMGATVAFVFTAAWSELLFGLMLINSESQKTFSVGLLTFIGKFAVDWGQMMAASVLALIPVCLFFLFLQRYLVTGLTAGAVKG